jgi:hypothetical protein
LFFATVHGQSVLLSGTVKEANHLDPVQGASVTVFSSSGVRGIITNSEGRFSIRTSAQADSVKFSFIGYRSKIYPLAQLSQKGYVTIVLETEPAMLPEIVIRPLGVMDIIHRAARNIRQSLPVGDFESEAFYREIIADTNQYYSVAEAIFAIQFNTQERSAKLKMEKGRTKQDVAYTRLFEDFHPGGGPEEAIKQSISMETPDFLNEATIKNYTYKKDSLIRSDSNLIYVISFDQQPGLQEALEKGKLYINADDFSLLKFEAQNSPRGTPYIKSLRGTDKIFAGILHIHLANRGWTRTASFMTIGTKVFLQNASLNYYLDYQQPKKNIDLKLHINTELVITDFQRAISKEITREEEWKRKNLVANLPSAFDSSFWGSLNILSPTSALTKILDSLRAKNEEQGNSAGLEDWKRYNQDFFTAFFKNDSLIIIPLLKSNWENNETGGMVYKTGSADFDLEAKITLRKQTSRNEEPDNGFQQCGFIVRDSAGRGENNIIFSIGTGGSDRPKYFLKNTSNGKTAGTVEKIDRFSGWMKLEKRKQSISLFWKSDQDDPWTKIKDYALDWLSGDLQYGFSVMSRFPGNGPKQHPDLEAIVSGIKMTPY